MPKRALVVTDIQKDFCEGGALAVPDGDAIVAVVNEMARDFDLVVATHDWHPADDPSFADQGGPWPPHCVIGTRGADLHDELDIGAPHLLIKATPYDKTEGTKLIEFLESQGANQVTVVGLALDYCVKETALGLARAGFEVEVPLAASRPVAEETAKQAVEQLRAAGIRVI